MLFWQTALQFLNASKKLGTDHLPARYLACHRIEMALKSHLRGGGYTLGQLKGIGHSICRALAQATLTGMKKPPERVRRVLAFAEEIHSNHEYRYPHLHRPKFIGSHYLIFAGAWALGAAAPAVVRGELPRHPKERAIMKKKMLLDASDLMKWAAPKSPPSGDEILSRMMKLLAEQNAD